ncbi:MAG: DUF4249 family protein [Bacteroidota bacterium]
MKKALYIILITSFIAISCEEVIDVNLNESSPSLVTEGSILYNSLCNVRLIYTSSFFDTAGYAFEDEAIITISDSEERSEVLEYIGEGNYRGNVITGLPGHTYTMSITVGDNEYRAQSKLNLHPTLLQLKYEELEIPHHTEKTIYTIKSLIVDDRYHENYYLFRYYRNGEMLNDHYSTYSDRFIQSDTVAYSDYMLHFYGGDTVKVELYAIDREVYNYFNLVNDVLFSARNSSTPFNPSSNFSGDILGYFMAASLDTKTIIIDYID